MANLTAHFIRRITAEGPISVADYMLDCLLHPTLGYYTTRDPLGSGGDFVTAPEISQMFGEMVGLCLAQSWIDQGQPAPFALAELGPGRGTLMADILRATRGVPGFHDAMQVHLVEVSPVLRDAQAAALKGYAPVWHDNIAALPVLPLFMVANEFFDALPIRQFIRDGETGANQWRERMIGLTGDDLTFGLSEQVEMPTLAHRAAHTKPGDMVETCTPAVAITAEISARIAQQGGTALIIDYGDWHALGDTFQAVKSHTKVDVLHDPGNCDLTAHVAFAPLADVATQSNCAATTMTTQGAFLEHLGITNRAQVLAANGGKTSESIILAHRRLTHPEEMGTLFKVMALYPQGTPPPPGLTAQNT